MGSGAADGTRRASSRRGAGARWADKEEAKAEALGPLNATPARAGARAVAKPPTAWLYGGEVQGRKIEVLWEHVGEWFGGRVEEYDTELDQHRVAYSDGDVEWVRLGKRRFRWLSNPRPGCAPNPSYKGSPRGRTAVGRKVRVFWPGMGKWYIGSIKEYDADKGEHLVAYKDGERQSLQLRNEPIQWLPVEGEAKASSQAKTGVELPPPSQSPSQQQPQQPPRRREAGDQGRAHSDSKDSEGDAVDPAVFSGGAPKGGARGADGPASVSDSDGEDGNGASPQGKKRKAVGRGEGVNGDSERQKRAKGDPGSSSEGGGVPTTEGPRTPENLEAGESDDEEPAAASRDPGAHGHVGSMDPEAGRALVGRRVSVWSTVDHRYRKGAVLGFDQDACLAFLQFEGGVREWADLGKVRMKLLGEDSPGARGQSGSPLAAGSGGAPPKARRSPRRSIGSVDAACTEFGARLGLKVGSRISLGGKAGGSDLGHVIAFKPQEGLTHVLRDGGSDEWLVLHDTSWAPAEGEAVLPRPRQRLAVGWRVAVYWPEDHKFYQGKILDFSADSGRHFVSYKDGDSEWLRISRAWVKWVEGPPGVSTPTGGSPAGAVGGPARGGAGQRSVPGGASGRKAGASGGGAAALAAPPAVSLDMPLAQLRERFFQAFGRKTTSNNKWWLLKKLGAGDSGAAAAPRAPRADFGAVAATATVVAPVHHPTPTVTPGPAHGGSPTLRNSLEGLRLVFSNSLPAEAEQAMRSARRGHRGDDQRRQLLNRLMKLNTICTYVDSCEQLAHDLEMTNKALPSEEFDGLGVSSEVAVNPLSFFT